MNVSEIQMRLTELGFSPGALDGRTGPLTRIAVRQFQKAYGLVEDGIAGPQTCRALLQATTIVKPGRAEPDKSAMSMSCPPPEPLPAKPQITAKLPNIRPDPIRDTARPINLIVWHCAATREGEDFTVADIRAWHKARGWSDIGYHFVVYRDGRIMVGRPIGQVGSHVAGKNTGSVGCCYIGGVAADGKTPKDTRTFAQTASMRWLTSALIAKFPIRIVAGHNEYAAKACPSFDVRNDPLAFLLG